MYIFRKAAAAALQKMHTFIVDILIFWGMIKENNSVLKNILLNFFIDLFHNKYLVASMWNVTYSPSILMSIRR